MGIDVIATVLAAIASRLAGGVASSGLLRRLVPLVLGRPAEAQKPYSERLSELTASLTKASREVDSVLRELGAVARSREVAVTKLEADSAGLGPRRRS